VTDQAERPEERLALAARLSWEVRDQELLQRALSHRSWCAETPGAQSNERLEFLGDAVLGLVVTDHLFLTYPTLPEGELAKVRASVVNSAVLAEVAADLSVGDAILLGKGEGQSGGREKPSILADAMEALIGALYLDRGYAAAGALVMRLLGERIVEAAAGPGGQDYKTRLQELCARQLDELPHYQVRDEGPDHAKVFDAVVTVGGEVCGRGHGRSKKQAEQAAARVAWERLAHELSGERMPAAGEAGNGGPPGSVRLAAERPAGERSGGERPRGERLATERPEGERPGGERPGEERPGEERLATERPTGERPTGERPGGERPGGERPATKHSAAERSTAERSADLDRTGVEGAAALDVASEAGRCA
jgi:ribonuclease-3